MGGKGKGGERRVRKGGIERGGVHGDGENVHKVHANFLSAPGSKSGSTAHAVFNSVL